MRTVWVAVIWFMAGSLFFTILGSNDNPVWDGVYFTWDASRDLLFVLAAFDLIPKVNRWFLKPVIVYCSIRLLWEIIDLITGIGNEAMVDKVSNIGFLVLTVGVSLLLLKDLVNRWNRNS